MLQANDISDRTAIGFGNPYISLKYGQDSVYSIEFRGAYDPGIYVIGGRVYYNFNPEYIVVLFCGLEGDYTVFNNEQISGRGIVGYCFTGAEYFITERLTFTLDLGPAIISLWEKNTGVRATGISWLFNLGVNWYIN